MRCQGPGRVGKGDNAASSIFKEERAEAGHLDDYLGFGSPHRRRRACPKSSQHAPVAALECVAPLSRVEAAEGGFDPRASLVGRMALRSVIQYARALWGQPATYWITAEV